MYCTVLKRAVAFLAVLSTAAAAGVQAQPAARMHRIAFVGSGVPGPGLDAFRQGMRELGYTEGKNLLIETRFPGTRLDKLDALLADVIASKVEIIVVGSTPAALAAKRATSSIPVVFASLFDPVGSGVVPSLARPAGNITGVAIGVGGSGMAGKWIELLKEAAPSASHVAVLANTRNPANAASVQEIEDAARRLAVKLDVLNAGDAGRLEKALAAVAASGVHGLVVTNDPFFTTNRAKVIDFVTRARLPAVYFFATFAEAGGLMAYGANQLDVYRRAASYVDKILKGAKPAQLPIEQPTRLELVVNVKAATAIGLELPRSLLLRADRIIE